MKTKPRTYRCTVCNRRMKRWVFSKTTRQRYCWPGEGCNKPK